MGLRFQHRIKVLPGVRINLSKSGVGLSVGSRGAHIGIDSRGPPVRFGRTAGGVSWREYVHKPVPRRCDLCAPGHVHIPPGAVVIVVLAVAAVVMLLSISR